MLISSIENSQLLIGSKTIEINEVEISDNKNKMSEFNSTFSAITEKDIENKIKNEISNKIIINSENDVKENIDFIITLPDEIKVGNMIIISTIENSKYLVGFTKIFIIAKDFEYLNNIDIGNSEITDKYDEKKICERIINGIIKKQKMLKKKKII